MRKRLKSKIIWVLLLLTTGCTSMCERSHYDMSPEEVVETYLNIALNMETLEEREDLIKLTAGNLRAAISGANDETMNEAYVNKNFELLGYSVVERRNRTPREVEITFQLEFKDFGKEAIDSGKAVATITTENTVSVIKEKRLWLIQDVLGAKTTIDFPVMPESLITPEKK